MKRNADESHRAGKKSGTRKSSPLHSADSAMVRRLRRRFVATSMSALLIIVLLMVAVINLVSFAQIRQSAERSLDLLADNSGTFPDNSSPRQNNDSSDPAASDNEQTDSASSDAGSDRDTPGDASDGQGPSRKNEPRSFPDNDINENSRLEAPYETRYFSVTLDAAGNVLSTDTSHIAAITEDVAQEYALTVYYNGKSGGYATSYRYRVVSEEDGNLLVIFVDCSTSMAEAQQLMIYTAAVGAAALALMFVLVWLFSGRSVAPVVESLEKQKRFISDAGHELKTPITIISANVDVLEMMGERSEWTQSIRSQTIRMTDLINNMLTLSRMEEESIPVAFTEVDFSSLVQECADSFEAVAQSNGLDYNVAVRKELCVSGDPSSLRQLCTILLDNAMKYSSDHGSVYLTLHRDMRESARSGDSALRGRSARLSNVILEVSNTCDAIPEGNPDRLFDRFYRADASRTRESRATWHVGAQAEDADPSSTAAVSRSTGGFGIGLSVARAVVTAHGGSIHAHIDGDRLIRFEVSLPEKVRDTEEPREAKQEALVMQKETGSGPHS